MILMAISDFMSRPFIFVVVDFCRRAQNFLSFGVS